MFTTKIKTALKKVAPGLFGRETFDVLLGNISAKATSVPAVSFGAEGANAIAVTVQLKDVQGDNLAEKRLVHYRVSSTAGGAPAGTAPTGGTAVSTGTLVKELTAGVCGIAETDATGKLVLTLTDTGTATFYVIVEQGGAAVVSDAVTFA